MRIRRVSSRAAGLLSAVLLLVLHGCGDSTGPGDGSPIRSVSITPPSATIDSGATQQFSASVDAEPGVNTAVDWRSSAPGVATFRSQESQSATVLGASPGEATITAVSVVDSSKSASAALTVERVPAVTSIDVTPSDTSVQKGSTVQLSASVETGRPGVSDAASWTSADTSIATVDSTGLVTGQDRGEAVIRATAVADSTMSDSATVSVTEEQASVTLESFAGSGSGNTLSADSLFGSVDVVFTLDVGDEAVDAVQLLVDSTAVDSVTGSRIPGSGSLVDTLTVNTAAVDSAAAGHVRYRNGDYSLAVRALDGDSVRDTDERVVEFRNSDTFSGDVNFDGNTADDSNGREWFSGDVTASVLPLLYTPDRELRSVKLFFPDVNVVDSTTDASDAYGVTFRDSAGAGNDISGVMDTSAFVRVKESTTTDGASGPGPVDVGDTVRLDNAPPQVGGRNLLDWVSSSDSTSITVNSVSDPGIPERDTAYTLNGEAYDSPTFAEAADDDSATWKITVTDGVGNAGSATIHFGIDGTRPTIAFSDSSAADQQRFTAGNPSDEFIVAPEDTLSGLDGGVRTTLIRRLPGLSDSDGCVVGNYDGGCHPVRKSDSVEVDEGADGEIGYFRYTGFALDSAGNPSDTLTREVLVDDAAPTVSSISLPSDFDGAETISADATLSDSLDLWRYEHQLRWRNRDPFDDAGALAGTEARLQFSVPASVDSAFDGNLVDEESVETDVPFFYRQLQQIDDTQANDNDIEASSGVKPNRLWVNAIDAARNEGDSTGIINDAKVEDGTDFADELVYFRVAEPSRDFTLDVDGQNAGQFSEVVILQAEVVMDQTGDSIPFDRVDFYLDLSTSNDVLLKIGTSTSVVTDRTEDVDSDPGDERIVAFEVVWDPTLDEMRLVAGKAPGEPVPGQATAPNVYAVGVDGDGDAIITNEEATDDEGNDGDTGDSDLTLRK